MSCNHQLPGCTCPRIAWDPTDPKSWGRVMLFVKEHERGPGEIVIELPGSVALPKGEHDFCGASVVVPAGSTVSAYGASLKDCAGLIGVEPPSNALAFVGAEMIDTDTGKTMKWDGKQWFEKPRIK